jgi:thiamine biosynthesis lipoprotein ApbE
MGTVITQRVFGGLAREALRAAEAEVVRLEGLLSRFQPTSEVSEINRHAGSGSIRVSAGTYQLLSQAAEYSELCHGCASAPSRRHRRRSRAPGRRCGEHLTCP